MGARPLVPHCPNPECKERLSRYNFESRYGRQPGRTLRRRPSVPIAVVPIQTKRRWQNHRLMTLTLHRCPDCKHEWWSTAHP